MFKYKVTYIDGSNEIIRASSPRDAEKLALNGIVAHIKWIRK